MQFVKDKLNRIGLQNKQLIVDSALAFFVRCVAALASFFMNMVVARQLGVYQSGNFFLCIALITVAAVFLGIGGNNQLIRFGSIYSEENKWNHVGHVSWQIIKRVLIFSIFFSGILIFACDFIAKEVFAKNDLSPTLFWMLLTVPIYTVTISLAFALQGIKKISMSICLQGVFAQVALTVLVLILKPNQAFAVAKLYFFVSLCTLIIGAYSWVRLILKQRLPAIEKPHLPSTFWRSTMILWIFSVLQVSIQWSGQFIAGMYSKPEDLARLAVAQRTSMLISFVLIAINLVSAPRFAALYNQKRMDELKKYAIAATRLMVYFATPIVLIMFLFPQYILSLFGKGFDNGTFMLRVLVLGQYVNVLTGSVAYLLMMSGHERELKNITIVSGVTSIILNIFLVRMYGVYGAAVATAISVALQNLLAVNMVNKKLGFNTLAIWK